MDLWKAITAQLGQLDQRWPKHRGHLKTSDRFRLVAFLFLNDVPQPIIRKLSSTKHNNPAPLPWVDDNEHDYGDGISYYRYCDLQDA